MAQHPILVTNKTTGFNQLLAKYRVWLESGLASAYVKCNLINDCYQHIVMHLV